jgi:hypothetical protein
MLGVAIDHNGYDDKNNRDCQVCRESCSESKRAACGVANGAEGKSRHSNPRLLSSSPTRTLRKRWTEKQLLEIERSSPNNGHSCAVYEVAN